MDGRLSADLSALFHFNTKQLWVWLSVVYTGEDYQQNEVVLWNDVIHSPEEARLDSVYISNYGGYNLTIMPVYEIRRQLKGNKNVSLVLNWEAGPYLGLVKRGRSKNSVKLDMPLEYSQLTRSRS